MQNIVKNTTIVSILDLLAPHSCRCCGQTGAVLCDRCKNYLILNHANYCPNCKTLNPTGKCQHCPDLSPIFTFDERQNLIGGLIEDLKYHSLRALAPQIASLLDATLPKFLGQVIVVPLPTIDKHIRSRGLDHTYLIAKHLTKLRGSSYHVEKLLVRKSNTVQVGSDAKTRKKQAKNAYALNKSLKINNEATYLLFDDVWTTGASMQNALALLKTAGIRKTAISVLAFSYQ